MTNIIPALIHNGERLPPFLLPSSRGVPLGPARYRQRQHLIVLLLDPATDAGRTYLTAMVGLYPEFVEMSAEVLALLPGPAAGLPAWVEQFAAPFPLLADDGTARARLVPASTPPTTAAVFVADRYGVLVYHALAASPATLDPPAEVLAWVRAVGMQCGV